MTKKLHFIAAFVAALSVSAAEAQDTTNNQTAPVSTADSSAVASGDASGYGGAVGKSASGSMTRATGTTQPACIGPVSFCDIYKGGN